LGVAIIVLVVCYRLGKRSVDVLLDKAPLETVNKIELVLSSIPEVKYYYNLKVRTSGADTFIKVVIALDDKTMFETAHEICSNVEKKICLAVERCDIFIHPEPFIQKSKTDEN